MGKTSITEKITFTPEEVRIVWKAMLFTNTIQTEARQIPKIKEHIANAVYSSFSKLRVQNGGEFKFNKGDVSLGTQEKAMLIEFIDSIDWLITELQDKISVIEKLK